MNGKRKSAQFWLDHIRAWKASGLTQRRYSEQSGIACSALRYWVGRANKGVEKLDLVAVRPVGMPTERGCVLRGPGGWVVEFGAGPSAAYLAELLGALR